MHSCLLEFGERTVAAAAAAPDGEEAAGARGGSSTAAAAADLERKFAALQVKRGRRLSV